MAGASLSVHGLAELQEKVRKMARTAANRTELYREAGEIMTKTEIPLIFRESGPGWAPTLRGGKILQDTGRLRDSNTYTVEPQDLVVGNPLKYAGVHQYGATIKAKNAPFLVFKVNGKWAKKKEVTIQARPFLKWTERGLKRIARRWADMIGGTASVGSI